MKQNRFILASITVALFAIPTSTMTVHADDIDTLEKAWTAVGSTGALDAASLSIAQLNDTGSIAIRSTVRAGVLKVRYNVTAVDGIHNPFSADNGPCLWATVRANTPEARVRVRLIEVPWAPNPNVVLGEIDSGSGFGDTDYHVMQNCSIHQPGTLNGIPSFGFFLRAYYILAELTKSGAHANPGLKVVALSHDQA